MLDARSKMCPWLAAGAWLLASAWFFFATGLSWGDVTGGMVLWSAPAAVLALQTVRWLRLMGRPLPARAVRWLAGIWVALVAFAFAVAGYGVLAGDDSEPVLAVLDQPMRIIYATFTLLVTLAALAGIARLKRAPT